ncbi:MAG: hypothetical protein H8E10_08140 [Desulfobacterales bacterium]|nr:hypothetical protein [Desulfobacterales bacterium]
MDKRLTEHNLPKMYKGYSTKALLKIWDQVGGDGITPGTPVEKIRAMRDLLREYKLGVHAAWVENQIG